MPSLAHLPQVEVPLQILILQNHIFPVKNVKLPIGYSNFRKLIDQKLDFVDKSLLIEAILNDLAETILITRPRRFGKTLNMSMLQHFFAKEVDGVSTEELFNGLKIMQAGEAVLQHHRQYPVIFLTFKDIKESTYENAYAGFCSLIQEVYSEHAYLLSSSHLRPEDHAIYQSILNQTAPYTAIAESLKKLCHYLFLCYGAKPIILIDEYDTPIQSAYFYGYYDSMIVLFRHFLGAALKDNSYLFKAVLTGILRISKESLFSGLNNLRVYSVLRRNYSAYFGFTETEVLELLEKSQLMDQLADIKAWYNGYQIGSETLYNPWSIVNCIENGGELEPHWINTSDNALVKELLIHSEVAFKARFADLVAGKAIEYLINEQFTFLDLKQTQQEIAIWSLLLMTGYLKVMSQQKTIRGPVCQLMIPNLEVRSVYLNTIEEWLANGEGVPWYLEFIENLLKGDMLSFEQRLTHILTTVTSVHDVSITPEAFYHGFMIGLTASLYSDPNYETLSNRKAGFGRYDFMIYSRDPEKYTILFEFKRIEITKNKQENVRGVLRQAAQEALSQMDQRGYLLEAQQRGAKKILKIGIAFSGKKFGLAYE